MTVTISKKHDAAIVALTSGAPAGATSTLLTAVKTYLDANFARFKNTDGDYTTPHVMAALNAVRFKGT